MKQAKINETTDKRITELEKEVTDIRRLVKSLSATVKKLDGSLQPLSTRVRVVGSLRDGVSRAMNPE